MRRFLSRFIDPIRCFLRSLLDSETRAALRLALPAAIVAIALRAWLIHYMPAAFVHNDTASIVETPATLLTSHGWHVEGKKTFLAPLISCVPAVLHLPILPFLSVFQHALGVAAVFLVASLIRAWLVCWRALVVPGTLLFAVHPVLLWYEHAALTETYAVVGILLVALAGTLLWRRPDRWSLALLLGALLFMAGARPEGKLFCVFALLLVVRVFWGKWRRLAAAFFVTLLWSGLLVSISRTSQSGLLLFTSVLHLAPDSLWFSPGVSEAVADLRDEAHRQWVADAPKLVPLRKALQERLVAVQVAAGTPADEAAHGVNGLSLRAAMEVTVRRAALLPPLAVESFVIAHRELPAPGFNTYAWDGQLEALLDDDGKALRYSPLLWGNALRDRVEAADFLKAEYRELPGDFPASFQARWVATSLLPLLPWGLPGSNIERVPVDGIPWLYACALVGMILLAARESRPLGFHQIWGLFLIGLFVTIMVTANIRARFRVLFEPFWILYTLALLDSLVIFARRWMARPAPVAP